MPRKEKPVSELSDIGKENVCRAQLGSKHRFCGNYFEVVSGAPVVNIRHDMITSQLYIHTIRIQHMADEESYQSLIHYVEAYSDFGMHYAEYKVKMLIKYEAEMQKKMELM